MLFLQKQLDKQFLEKEEVNTGSVGVKGKAPRKYGSQESKSEERISWMVVRGCPQAGFFVTDPESKHSRERQENKKCDSKIKI